MKYTIGATLAILITTAGLAHAKSVEFDFDNLADLPGIPGHNEGSWESRPDGHYTGIGLGVTDTYVVDGISVKATGGSYDPSLSVSD